MGDEGGLGMTNVWLCVCVVSGGLWTGMGAALMCVVCSVLYLKSSIV